MTALRELFSDGSVQLISLVGRTGVGKTRLALEAAWSVEAECPGTSLFVSLSAVPSSSLVLSAVARGLGIEGAHGSLPALVASKLANTDSLLVLDTFEHLLDAVVLLEDLLERCQGLRLLVTSQTSLHSQAERVVRVLPLPLPDAAATELSQVADQPAVALYCHRARAVDNRFRLGEDNWIDVVTLCRELEGLPLALELAAARSVTLPPGEIVRRLGGQRLDLLRSVSSTEAPSRHQDLRSAIGWTFELLSPHEQTVLLRLSVAEASFDIDDVEAIVGDELTSSLDALSTLVDLHLVEPVPGIEPPRFELLSSIRDFAQEKLEASGERSAAQASWVAWLAGRAREAALGLDTADADHWWRWIDQSDVNLVRALQVCAHHDKLGEAINLLTALAPHWNSGVFAPSHHRLLDQTLDLAERRGTESAALAEVLLWAGLLDIRVLSAQTHDVGLRRLHRGQHLARVLGDPRLQLLGLYFQVLVVPMTGETKAVEAASEGVELARQVGSAPWQARFQIRLGSLADHTQRAIECYLSGLNAARQASDTRTVLEASVLLLPMARDNPDVRKALLPSMELLATARSTHQTTIETILLAHLAIEALVDDQPLGAATHCFQLLSVCNTDESSYLSAYGLLVTTLVAAARSDHEFAAEMYGCIADAEDGLTAVMPSRYVSDYRRAMERLRKELGVAKFEFATKVGRSRSRATAIDQARVYLRGVLSPELTGRRPRESLDPAAQVLTERQLEVITLLARGLTNEQIASRLGVTTKTVMHHTGAIYTRLGVRGRVEAVALAIRTGLVEAGK